MKNAWKATFQVEQPEIEIIVRNQQEELACLAFFSAGATEWDVAVGLSDPKNRDAIVSALQSAADALASAAFRLLPSHDDERGHDFPPF